MGLLLALGISIGVLIAGWVYVAVGIPELHLIVWPGIIAWGTFYAANGGVSGLTKTIASNLVGNFWAAVALTIFLQIGGGVVTLAILVGIIAFIFCIEAKIDLFSFIPGAFLGAATWVGVDVAGAGADGGAFNVGDLMISVSMIAGAVLGYISELIGKQMAGAT